MVNLCDSYDDEMNNFLANPSNSPFPSLSGCNFNFLSIKRKTFLHFQLSYILCPSSCLSKIWLKMRKPKLLIIQLASEHIWNEHFWTLWASKCFIVNTYPCYYSNISIKKKNIIEYFSKVNTITKYKKKTINFADNIKSAAF